MEVVDRGAVLVLCDLVRFAESLVGRFVDDDSDGGFAEGLFIDRFCRIDFVGYLGHSRSISVSRRRDHGRRRLDPGSPRRAAAGLAELFVVDHARIRLVEAVSTTRPAREIVTRERRDTAAIVGPAVVG